MKLSRILHTPSTPSKPTYQNNALGSVTNPTPRFMELLNTSNANGAPISSEASLRIGVFFFCVRLIASAIASMNISTFKKEKGNKRVEAPELPSGKLLSLEVNNSMSVFHWLMFAIAQCVIQGNHYAEIVRNKYYFPVALKPIYSKVTTVIDEYGEKWHVYNNGQKILHDRDMFHLFEFTMDGIAGLSRIKQHRMGLGLGLSKLKFENDFYKAGTLSGGVITLPEDMRLDDEYEDEIDYEGDDLPKDSISDRVRNDFKRHYSGEDNYHKIMVLEDGMKFTPLSMSLADAKHVEGSIKTDKDICLICGVPPRKAGIDTGSNNYKSPEEADKAFMKEALLPFVNAFESEANRKLIPSSLQHTYYHKFNMASLFRASIKERYEAYAIGLGSKSPGFLAVDEIRAWEELTPGDESKLWSPINMSKQNTSRDEKE